MIRLTGGDLKRMTDRLGLTSVNELRTRGLVSMVLETIGDAVTIWRPRIRFRTKPIQQCPFLVNDIDESGGYHGLCSLHPDFKPLVCALSPFSRQVEDSGDGFLQETWTFLPPVEHCPGVGRGEPMILGAPENLLLRLNEEVKWMRRLVELSPQYPDEDSSWNLLTPKE